MTGMTGERRWHKLVLLRLVPLLWSLAILAQTQAQAQVHPTAAPAVARAAAAITAQMVTPFLSALAADSLRQRATPSPGLDRAAQYLAAEFQRFGLQPLNGINDHGAPTWVDRYPLPGRQPIDSLSILALLTQVTRHGKAIVGESAGLDAPPLERQALLRIGQDAYFAPEVGPQTVTRVAYNFFIADPVAVGKPLILISGRWTVAAVQQHAADFRDHLALYVPAPGVDPVLRRHLIQELYRVSQQVLIASTETALPFAATAAAVARQQLVTRTDDYLRSASGPHTWPWALWVRGPAIQDLLQAAAVDLSQLQADTTPQMQVLPATTAFLLLGGKPDTATTATAPNVMGWLEGSDSALRDQVLVLSAHLDNAALRTPTPRQVPDQSDSLAPTADDNTAGVAVLLAVAQALSQPGARPQRSVVFLAPSGGTHALWGAHWFVETRAGKGQRGKRLVLDINLDHLDGPASDSLAGDSLLVDGLQEVELAATPLWVAAAHPELNLRIGEGETVAQPSSDHFAFVGAAIPSLYLHAGMSLTDASTATASRGAPRGALDADRLARIARAVFFLAQVLGNAPQSPRWSAAGYQQLHRVLSVDP